MNIITIILTIVCCVIMIELDRRRDRAIRERNEARDQARRLQTMMRDGADLDWATTEQLAEEITRRSAVAAVIWMRNAAKDDWPIRARERPEIVSLSTLQMRSTGSKPQAIDLAEWYIASQRQGKPAEIPVSLMEDLG